MMMTHPLQRPIRVLVAVVVLSGGLAALGAGTWADIYALVFTQINQGAGASSAGRYTMEDTLQVCACSAYTEVSNHYATVSPLSTFSLDRNGQTVAWGTAIVLTWSAEGKPGLFSGFDVYRSETGQTGSFVKINPFPLNEPSYQDTDLLPGRYYYQVFMVDTSDASRAWTPVLDATIVLPLAVAGQWAIYE
jgi:hypothetical protein